MKTVILLYCLCITGCSWLSVQLTPKEVVDSVARGSAVANNALVDPPETPEELQQYFEVNAEMWRQLSIWFEIREE